jgi:hypothetical protein
MNTPTLFRERLQGRQSLLLRAFASFLLLLTVLGFSQQAFAQAVDDNSISLNQQVSGASGVQRINYRGSYFNGDTPYNTYTQLGQVTTNGTVVKTVPSIGTYDLNGTSSLALVATSLVAEDGTGRGAITVTGAQMYYRVYPIGTNIPSTSAYPFNPVSMTDQGTYNGITAPPTHNFQGTANVNLLAGLTTGGDYNIEVYFVINKSDGSIQQDPAGYYQAKFTLTAPPAPTLSGTYAYLAPNGGANQTYNVNPPSPNKFQDANLGTAYDINSGTLLLNGGAAITTEAGANTITNVTLYYRVRLTTQAGGAFSFVNLPLVSNNSGTRTFQNQLANINLISGLSNTGNYKLDIYYQASGTNSSNPSNPVPFTQLDNNNGSYYSANFTVTGTPIPSTVWVGGINDDWFNKANWTNGVPDANTNATIRNLGSGVNNLYPNIYSNATYTYTPTGGTAITIDNSNSGPALCRDLTMEGNSNTDRSILRLQVGELQVYGNFSNRNLSFIQREYSTLNFAGGNQNISNGDFKQVIISGSGVKYVLGIVNVGQSLTFTGGLLVTDITSTSTSQVNLDDRGAINNQQGAQLIGETDAHYLRGFVRTVRNSTTLEDQYTYGNIGMGLVWHGTSYDNPNTGSTSNDGGNPGSVEVTRNTSEAFNPVANTSGIRRIFGVRPGSPGATTGGLNADMTFKYLNSETKSLGAGGNVRIQEQNLVLFRSINNGGAFTNLGRTTLDTVANVLTRNAVTTFATFTLGDQTNPLPVKLVAFDAKRQGNNTLVTWATADETNNAGFEVQVSTDAKTFRKLSFVNSYSNNSTAYQTYSYTDIEAGKSGVRYYRLRQVDLDGKQSFSPVKAVSFATAAAGAVAINIYPNPSTTADQTTLVVQSSVAGQGKLQVMDLTGRTIISRDITTVAGVTELAVPVGSELSAGIYLVKVTLPSGEVKTTRMQKN